MIRLLVPFLFFLFCLPLPLFAGQKAPLRMHVWVSYMPPWLLESFTKETGIPVQVTFFADNRDLLRKMRDESEMTRYDLVSPSSEAVQRLVADKLLQPLSPERIPNMQGLDPWFALFAYDKNFRHSVPLFWGGLGIVIDTQAVPKEVAATILGYEDLWRPELAGKIMLPNDLRSLMSIMLLSLGYSVNDPDPAHLDAAMSLLEKHAPSVNSFSTVDQLEDLRKRSIVAGVAWANETFTRDGPNAPFQFLLPKEGSPLWVDALAIPANAQNPEAAHAFIDFILRPENLARLSETSGYAVASPNAIALLPESLRSNTVVYPPKELRSRLEVELLLPSLFDEAITRRWVRLKNSL